MASTVITTSGAEDARIVVAFGRRLGLGRNATQGEVVADIRRYMTSVVLQEEQNAAMATALVGITPIAPT